MHLFAALYMESVWQVTVKISQLIYFQYPASTAPCNLRRRDVATSQKVT